MPERLNQQAVHMLSDTPLRIRPRQLLMPLFGFGAAGYFVFNLFIGDYSLAALHRLRAEGVELRAELSKVQKQRQEFELRVSLMRPESIDPDMLDERARETLNLSHPDDITIVRAAR